MWPHVDMPARASGPARERGERLEADRAKGFARWLPAARRPGVLTDVEAQAMCAASGATRPLIGRNQSVLGRRFSRQRRAEMKKIGDNQPTEPRISVLGSPTLPRENSLSPSCSPP